MRTEEEIINRINEMEYFTQCATLSTEEFIKVDTFIKALEWVLESGDKDANRIQ